MFRCRLEKPQIDPVLPPREYNREYAIRKQDGTFIRHLTLPGFLDLYERLKPIDAFASLAVYYDGYTKYTIGIDFDICKTLDDSCLVQILQNAAYVKEAFEEAFGKATVVFSGAKGFHVVINDVEFSEVAKQNFATYLSQLSMSAVCLSRPIGLCRLLPLKNFVKDYLDTKVLFDAKRLLRIPNTVNMKTSFMAVEMSEFTLEELRKKSLWSKRTLEVAANTDFSISLFGEHIEMKKGQRRELQANIAYYLNAAGYVTCL